MITKVTFVGDSFTRKPPKFERFIRPSGLRFKKANVTHPELKATFQLDIIGVKKNPSSPMYTSLGVITKGTIIEVNVSELGLVTPSGKIVWGKLKLRFLQIFFFSWTIFFFSPPISQFFIFFLRSGKYAQVTNNPENDGCINAVLLV